jgi:hypothetical protein
MPILEKGKFKTIPGANYGTPKELWGFRWRAPRARPIDVANLFLRAEEKRLGVRGADLGSPRVVESMGATHVILQQKHRDLPIYRAYVTVHISHDGHVYLVKNRAVPERFRTEKGAFRLTAAEAEGRARAKLRGARVDVTPAEARWFPQEDKLCPAYRVRMVRKRPREEWITYVNASTGGILSHYDNLASQRPSARIFNPNPLIGLADWRSLLTAKDNVRRVPPEAYTRVFLGGLKLGSVLSGRRVTTELTPGRVRSRSRRFEFVSTHAGFLEAMVYHHIDRAVHYLEWLGYRGRRAIFKEAIPVNARGTREDNSWYSPTLRALTFGTGGVDDAEDAEIILHEFGHAMQDAICPGFGQSVEAAAMGEGFGDYLAASFFAAIKPAALRDCVMSWDAIAIRNDPPSLRRLDGRLTFKDLDPSDDASEHDNGTIWAATLWDIWNALGRDVADRIIVESHFQLDGFTTFARGARAIIDADQNLNDGDHESILRRIFRRRGIGPL